MFVFCFFFYLRGLSIDLKKVKRETKSGKCERPFCQANFVRRCQKVDEKNTNTSKFSLP